MKALTCAERDAILHADGHYEGWSVFSSLTDPSGQFGGFRIETTWERDGRRITDVRNRAEMESGLPDVKPCEHYDLGVDE